MCEKCVELHRRISHLANLVASVTDSQTLVAIKLLTEKMQAEKTALHPE
jgi:hypothetical protein